MDKTPLLHMLKSHFYHTSDSTHPPSARVQKPKFGIIYVLAFHPSSAAIPILLDMGRSPSIPFLAVMCLITHQLPGRLPRGDGQFSEPCSLICKVCVAASKWDRWGEIPKASRVSQPQKESSPVAKQIGNAPRTGSRHGCAFTIYSPAR